MDILKEKREAIDAGKRAIVSLQKAKEKLEGASNWGIVDMLGGGFFSTMLKHSKMDEANREMQTAQKDLHIFANELSDLSTIITFDFQVDGFMSFADFFMDNCFVDMMVQSQINQAKQQVQQAIVKVEDILIHLSEEF